MNWIPAPQWERAPHFLISLSGDRPNPTTSICLVNAAKSASRVNLNHFDPGGVREPSLSLSQSSARARERSLRSDRTLAPGEPFSLEKSSAPFLTGTGGSFAFRWVSYHGACLTTLIGNIILMSRGENLVYTSRIFALLVLVPQCLTKQ